MSGKNLQSRCLIINALIFLVSSQNTNNDVHRRFEYKYSFKPPYSTQKDGTIPFWEFGGNALASADGVRVVPSLISQKGAIWTKLKSNFDWWEIEIGFQIFGRGRTGADGLAFWYTTEKGDYDGPVFGSSDRWNGLGLFFDSFDNDNQHNNPYIVAVVNDGSKNFDHDNDGTEHLLSACLRDFRNTPFPTRARIQYYLNTLTVLFHNGMTNNNDDYTICFNANRVYLPKNGYFGISAATGGLADNHDVYFFLTTSLHFSVELSDISNSIGNNSDSLQEEYHKYEQKFEKQKQEYKKDHINEIKDTVHTNQLVKVDNSQELQLVWQIHSEITEIISNLAHKIDDVIGLQETTLTFISTQLPQTPKHQKSGIHEDNTIQDSATITPDELDMMLLNQKKLIIMIREIKNIAGEVLAKMDNIFSSQTRREITQVQLVADDIKSITEIQNSFHQITQGLSFVNRRLDNNIAVVRKTACSTPNCLTLSTFLCAILVQLFALIFYKIYKRRRADNNNK